MTGEVIATPAAAGTGIVLSAGTGPERPWSGLADDCHAIEAMGYSAVWFTDHLFWGGACPDPLVAATVAATATDRCTIGTAVLQLPLRHAPSVAKAAATIAGLSEGRFVLGVGVGEHAEEYRRAGRDFAGRGRQLDHDIVEVRRLWHDDDPGWYRQLPAPPPVPVWVGGRSPAALRRTAVGGDGWLPAFVSADEYRSASAELDTLLVGAGRTAGSVVRAVVAIVAVTDDGSSRADGLGWLATTYGLPPRAFEHHLISGSAAEVAAGVDRYREAGAAHVALFPATDRPLAAAAALGPWLCSPRDDHQA